MAILTSQRMDGQTDISNYKVASLLKITTFILYQIRITTSTEAQLKTLNSLEI